MGKGFNGTTLSFKGANLAPLTSVSYASEGAEVATGGSTSTGYEYNAGLAANGFTVEVQGGSTITVGLNSTVTTVTWNDGTSTALGKTVCTKRETSGSLNDTISTSISIRPLST